MRELYLDLQGLDQEDDAVDVNHVVVSACLIIQDNLGLEHLGRLICEVGEALSFSFLALFIRLVLQLESSLSLGVEEVPRSYYHCIRWLCFPLVVNLKVADAELDGSVAQTLGHLGQDLSHVHRRKFALPVNQRQAYRINA